jgi:phosphoribosylformylglycinamidine synthase
MKATVLVRPKGGILDPQGDAVRGSLGHLGFAVREARVGRVIDLELDAGSATEARQAIERMCQSLLANPLIESYEIEIEDERSA